MKTSAGVLFAIVIVTLLAVFEIWQYTEQQRYRSAMQHQLVELTARLESAELALHQARNEVRELEQSSIGGMIDDANDALIQGWSAMMNAVERELESARKSFERRRREMDTQREGDMPAHEDADIGNQEAL